LLQKKTPKLKRKITSLLVCYVEVTGPANVNVLYNNNQVLNNRNH